MSIWQECTTYSWLVWESGTLAFSKEPRVLCHINKWQLWKWIHFKRTCQPETCPLCKKTFQNIFRLISSLNFPHHSWCVISVSFKLALLWRIHTHRHRSWGKPIMQIYMIRQNQECVITEEKLSREINSNQRGKAGKNVRSCKTTF